jgi:transglutaminase-like putative cysteine protease/predicted secreted protein
MTGFTPAAVTRRRPAMAGSPWRPVAVAAACALGAVGAIAAPRIGIPTIVGVVVAASAGVLAVLALPSVPTRRATVLLLGIAGLGALRHAALPTTDSMLIVLWALATLTTLVLADRADFEHSPAIAGSAPVAPRTTETTRHVIAIAAIVAVVCVAFVPVVTDKLGRSMWPGVVPSFGDALNSPTSLRSSGRIDMTERPRLTDNVVFTVDAPRADYWRGEVFDVWDGEAWTRSDRQQAVLPRSGDNVRVVTDPFDDGARSGETMRQTFHMESRFSELVFAAPSPVSVETDKQIVGRPDGTAMAVGGFGHHAVYTVTSRSALADADQLRAADANPIPQEVATRYAGVPVTTARVRELAQSVTANQPTDYDRIVALEAWLGAHTKYSLKAPLSPRGVDVVDHFLFTSQEGWCEQVASSLVVLARSVGIPARLATGFVPGERDRLTGRFTVRERDAHAWTEVYFPGIGWQGFDPTASVPLAGEAPPSNSWFDAARRHALQFGIGLAIAVWVIVSAPDLWAALRRRQRRRTTWGARAFSRLERLGRRRGRPRRADETPSEYARALAVHLDEPSLAQVGAVLDQEAFSTHEATAERRATVDAVLTMRR